MTDAVIMMSGFALQKAIEPVIIPAFERETGVRVDARWSPTTLIVKGIDEGAEGDVVVLADEAIDDLAARGLLIPETRFALADATVGLAVLGGQPKPDIGTTDAFRQAILSCRAVAYSRAGASGIYFEKLIERLGIADAVRQKAVVIPSGLTAEKLVSGEADLAVQQISELTMVDGIDVVGPFPQEIASVTGFSTAVLRSSRRPENAKQLVAALSSAAAMAAYTDAGLSPRR
ncbi:substrate-binding domain-containing protein [Pseudochelatococcus sp. B33]